MKNLKELLNEGKSGVDCKIFIMNCGSVYSKLEEYQLFIDLLNPKKICVFDDNNVQEINDIYDFKWDGPHFDDISVVSKYISKNHWLDGTNIILIP